MSTYSATDIARQFLFVREAGENKGQRVESIQSWSGGAAGDFWCCEFATMVLDICYQGVSPIPRLQACQKVYDLAKENNWLTDTPMKDDLFLYVDNNDHAEHIGIVTIDGGTTGIAGNTSADGKSRNGDRVAEHDLINDPVHVKFVQYPR